MAELTGAVPILVVALARAVTVPTPVKQLHVANTLLDQPPREETVVRETSAARMSAVGVERLLGHAGRKRCGPCGRAR